MKKTKANLIQVFSAILFERLFFQSMFLKPLLKETVNIKTVLELGAGKNSYIRQINKDLHLTALDISKESLNYSKNKGIYNEYVVGNAMQALKYFNKESFDMVVAFDLIEHLEKEQGFRLIEIMNQIAKKKILIYTPNGFLKQDPFDNNPFQEHISGWSYNEMVNMDFKIYGVNGYKKLRGMYSKPILKPVFLGRFISNLSWLILKVFHLERKSFAIMCFKDANKN